MSAKMFRFNVPKARFIDNKDCIEIALSANNLDGFDSELLDMLRYEDAKVTKKTKDGFIVESIRFTPSRWKSFGTRIDDVEEFPIGKDEFEHKKNENQLWFAKLSMNINEMCKTKDNPNVTGSELLAIWAKRRIKDLEKKNN